MPTPEAPPVPRSDRFILFFQLEALCHSLQIMIETKQPLTPYPLEMLRKLHADAKRNVTGPAVASIPSPSNTASLPDMLLLAEVLRYTMAAFLTPEEMLDTGLAGFRPPPKR